MNIQNDFINIIYFKQKSCHPNLPIETIFLHENELNFDYISKYHEIDLNFLALFQNKLNWNYISRRNDLTIQIVSLYKDKISWWGIHHSNLYKSKQFRKQFHYFIKKTRKI